MSWRGRGGDRRAWLGCNLGGNIWLGGQPIQHSEDASDDEQAGEEGPEEGLGPSSHYGAEIAEMETSLDPVLSPSLAVRRRR